MGVARGEGASSSLLAAAASADDDAERCTAQSFVVFA